MDSLFFTIQKVPDLTLNKYAAIAGDGLEDVLKIQESFLRQLHRKNLPSSGSREESKMIRWIFQYIPDADAGKRLKIVLQIETDDSKSPFNSYFAESSVISPFFQLERISLGKNGEGSELAKVLDLDLEYKWKAVLLKKQRLSKASLSAFGQQQSPGYFTVNRWEMNDDARLYNMFSMMKQMGNKVAELGNPKAASCAYVVEAQPVDYTYVIETERYLGKALDYIKVKSQMRYEKIGNVASIESDDNATYAMDRYTDLIKDISSNPHFQVNISTYADDAEYAKMLIDSAASEALSEGSYDIILENRSISHPISIRNIIGQKTRLYCNREAYEIWPELAFMPTLFMLRELRPFVVFPTLNSGETIEVPKETAPPRTSSGFLLGHDNDGYPVYMPYKNLVKHAFIAGVPGSGKTNTMLHIITSLHRADIPFLVFEPAKKEYRALLNKHLEGVTVYSPSAGTRFPLHINPFEFPIGMSLAEHISNLKDIFEGAFNLWDPLPFLVNEAIRQVYVNLGWKTDMINRGELGYPSIQELYDELGEIIKKYPYEGETKGGLEAAQRVRIGSLLNDTLGEVFNVKRSTLKPEEWITHKAIIELESMGTDPANFLTLVLSTLIRETLKCNPVKRKVSEGDKKPRHVIFFEEAHNLIGPRTEKTGTEVEPKVAATKYISTMIAEVRALNEGIVIADQIPALIAPEILKNTALKLGHKITHVEDIQLMASTMSADGLQMERMATYPTGTGLIFYDGLLKPFEMQIEKWGREDDGSDNEELYNSPSDAQLVELLSYEDSPYLQEMKAEGEARLDVWKDKAQEIYASIKSAVEIRKTEAADDYEEYVNEVDEITTTGTKNKRLFYDLMYDLLTIYKKTPIETIKSSIEEKYIGYVIMIVTYCWLFDHLYTGDFKLLHDIEKMIREIDGQNEFDLDGYIRETLG